MNCTCIELNNQRDKEWLNQPIIGVYDYSGRICNGCMNNFIENAKKIPLKTPTDTDSVIYITDNEGFKK